MGKNGARVYSYLRFSDPRQATGSSADRQLAYASAWASKHGMELDATLTLRDEGLSAYHETHVKQGALGAFLRAVDEGRIPAGSVLIVEGLDRLSRAEPLLAQAQLGQIVNAGITVVTASDGREYNREGLKAEPMNLVYSLLVMIRAHEESDTKSKRVKAAVRRQCEAWVAGSYRGRIVSGKDPQWLAWDGDSWQFIPERVEAVRFALDAYRSGIGAARLVRLMHEKGMVLSDWGIAAQQVYRLVRLPALRGAKRISIDGEDFMLEDYYPRLLSDEEFSELETLVGQRYRRRGKDEIVGIVTGIGITRCGYCGTALVAQNLMQRVKADGSLEDGHRRLHCVSYSKNGGCNGGSCSSVPIERAVLAYCSDQMNLQRLLEPSSAGEDLRPRLVEAQKGVAEIERQLERVTDALLADDSGAAPLAFVRKARELEEDLERRRSAVRALEQELVAKSASAPAAGASKWAELAERAKSMVDVDAREQARQLVMDTFETLVVYMRGVIPNPKGRYIDVMMKSRAGQTRWIRVDRRTGVWKEGADRPTTRRS
ncbi:recombinase family protein [Pseudomonas aeruginosa]|uniref:recombinase family protein n=1 Tax=Pseudomonas aeruginosa TaxID=287 RepID=UPI0015C052E3|nr:recombinase family protein [Pseudomonas aeruginosa]MBX6066327.1 recombinase family protein [Pseudomonas aeruginosa]MBX6242618.1 recombinase family protein [Pseudomonas aeruginosa]MBX6649944.1 recombinase family protein [Pseudomonas aeruginosa]MBX6907835.1 recombinase family protein [Pseudomonas aeruginosa]MCZ9674063.1 recombinase family protein [Pseudomonas aeruginosa]